MDNIDPLSLEFFIYAEDEEAAKYRFQGALQKVQREFRQNKLYPVHQQISSLYYDLKYIVDNAKSIEIALPQRIKSLGPVHKGDAKIFREKLQEVNYQLCLVLCKWAVEIMYTSLKEGANLKEFVNDALPIDIVGIEPSYKHEGYYLISNRGANEMNLYRYKVAKYLIATSTIQALSEIRHATVSLSLMKTFAEEADQSNLNEIKLQLIKEERELPNPATYVTICDIPLPYEETIYPVARERLAAHISSQ